MYTNLANCSVYHHSASYDVTLTLYDGFPIGNAHSKNFALGKCFIGHAILAEPLFFFRPSTPTTDEQCEQTEAETEQFSVCLQMSHFGVGNAAQHVQVQLLVPSPLMFFHHLF